MNRPRATAQLREWFAGKATNVRYSELAAVLRALDWTEAKAGSGGSHRSWWHRNSPIVVSVVDHGSGNLLPVYVKRAAKAALSLTEDTQ